LAHESNKGDGFVPASPHSPPWRIGISLVAGLSLVAFTAANSLAAHTQKAAGGIKAGGVVIVESNDEGPSPRNFNPFSPTAQLGTTGDIYETLLMYNTVASQVHPWLATKYVWSDHNDVLTFTIRKGVKWTDGKPFTAADVAYTFNLVLKTPAIDTSGLSAHVTKVVQTGPYTVQLDFKSPDVPLLYYIADTPIVPEHIWSKIADPSKYLDSNPVGTGPFILTSFTAANYVLKRNPNYWQAPKPYVSELVYTAYTVQAVETDLSAGKIAWANAYAPTLQKTYVDWDPSQNHYWFPPEGEVALFTNDGKAPFNNVWVRRAISYAVNRKTVGEVGETGFESPAAATGIILPNQQSWLDPTVAKEYPYTTSAAEAIKMLAKAGYHLNAQHKMVNAQGQQLTFTMDVVAGYPDWILDETIMVQELKAIGIDASSQQIAFNTYYANLTTGDFTIAMWNTGFGPTPYYTWEPVLSSVFYAPEGQTATNDFERWNDPATTKLLNEYAGTSNTAQEHQYIDQLEGILASELPVIPLVYSADWDEYRTNEFVGWPTPQDPYANPAPADLPWSEPVVLNIHLK
jgi:peptide/nickel transport system substrate-binding protein